MAGAGVSERPVLGRLFTGKGSKWQALALKCCLDSSFVNATFAEHEAQPLFFNSLYFEESQTIILSNPQKKMSLITSVTCLLHFWVIHLSMHLIIAKDKAVLFKYSRKQ